MVPASPRREEGGFRVPNSLVQGLTTNTTEGLNRLTAFATVTLLGLLTRVSSRHPHREVTVQVSDILDILQVSKSVAHAVERAWTTRDGRTRRQRYRARRFSPRHLVQVHEALLTLHGQRVLVRHQDPRSGRKVTERIVHVLDSFGYLYEIDGRALDVDDLPPGREKINVGPEDRPVWRVRRRTPRGETFDRPRGILFRLNAELAGELGKRHGTIGFTLFAHRVFGVFREFMKSPAAIRLVILVLRQTNREFSRRLLPVIDDLGWDVSHPTRAVEQLRAVLERMRALHIVEGFTLDDRADRMAVVVNRDWYQEGPGAPQQADVFGTSAPVF
jgi:hypothetical protein